MNRNNPDDAPELTDDFFARARPASEVLAPEIMAQFKRGRGRPRAEHAKTAVSIRLDRDIVERFKAGGAGWQTRINDTLRKALR